MEVYKPFAEDRLAHPNLPSPFPPPRPSASVQLARRPRPQRDTMPALSLAPGLSSMPIPYPLLGGALVLLAVLLGALLRRRRSTTPFTSAPPAAAESEKQPLPSSPLQLPPPPPLPPTTTPSSPRIQDPPRRRSYAKITPAGTPISGEIVVGEGWRRHTKVFGGGVCAACEESQRRLAGFA